MRGEDVDDGDGVGGEDGSPPHARGRLRLESRQGTAEGITPACAGKTRVHCRTVRRCKDHPRMRGEDSAKVPAEVWRAGSPPHARGRPMFYRIREATMGITPACAGKTLHLLMQNLDHTDHPRMRGEDLGSNLTQRLLNGSPPHARGRRLHDGSTKVLSRITPACAGKTQPEFQQTHQRTDHPRMRGEDRLACVGRVCVDGSPPHARGRLVAPFSCALSRRITPACAGKTPYAVGVGPN